LHSDRERCKRIALVFLALGWAIAFPLQLTSQQIAGTASAGVASSAVEQPDPTKPGSELNHHLVGYALIALGLLVIAGQSSPKLAWLQWVWPLLFIGVGIFLAVWSDGEIWPRGNLSWLWMVHHDAEARQHKIYALLLMAMGTIEYLRGRGKLRPVWRTWAFSLLAIAGAVLLLFHDHSAGPGGASSPEARQYWVPWSLTRLVTGAPDPPLPPSEPPPMHHHEMMAKSSAEMQHPEIADHESMSTAASVHGHQHVMTAAMIKIQQQHLWFALIGLAVVVFKFIDDSAMWRRPLASFLWPSWIAVLGMLLLSYTE
jgi:hypothetical protein